MKWVSWQKGEGGGGLDGTEDAAGDPLRGKQGRVFTVCKKATVFPGMSTGGEEEGGRDVGWCCIV